MGQGTEGKAWSTTKRVRLRVGESQPTVLLSISIVTNQNSRRQTLRYPHSGLENPVLAFICTLARCKRQRVSRAQAEGHDVQLRSKELMEGK
jgi:hypothetical protein